MRATKIVALVLSIGAIYMRAPDLVTTPRFWAEEGKLYAAYSYHHDLISSLLAPHALYYSLIANLGSTFAMHAVPLERAPLATMAFAFVAQMTPVVIVLMAPSPLWDGGVRRLVLVALIVLSATGEIWLTTIAASFHLSLTAALLLLVNAESLSQRQKIMFRGVLVIASLAGPPAVMLLPVYLLACWLEVSAERRIQAAIVAAGFVIEALVFLWSVQHDGPPAYRFSEFAPRQLMRIYVDGAIGHAFLFNGFYEEFPRLNWAVAALVGLVAARSLASRTTALAVLAAGQLSTTMLIGSIGTRGGERYFFATGVLLYVICLARVADMHRDLWTRLTRIAAVILIACAGVRSLATSQDRMDRFFRPTWPVWREEVARWRRDQSYRLRIHPQWGGASNWDMELTPGVGGSAVAPH